MGLDIVIQATPNELLEALNYPNDGDAERAAKDIAHVHRITEGREMDEPIHTRPGSYGGLHRVRCKYAELKGWANDGQGHVVTTGDSPALQSHLCNHSDCEGYYLPDDFETPLWHEDNSIGSSAKLLEELREIEGSGWEWDAVYLPALASVACHKVIYFR